MKLEGLIFPERLYCSCCGNIIDKTRTYSLCDHCMERFRWNLNPPMEIDGKRFITCTEYGIYERTLIFRLKYNGDRNISRIIAEIMDDKLKQAKVEGDLIIPVPLHPKKERRRGFNQTVLIGRHLAERTGMDFYPGALKRVRETKAMRGLSSEERRDNIQGAIELTGGYEGFARGKRALLVDDFYTTGSTAMACAKALEQAEPLDITVLTYARRTPMEELII